MQLLNNHPLESIKITDIAKEAHLGRSTFYLHYDSIYNLYEDLVEKYLDPISEIGSTPVGCKAEFSGKIKSIVHYVYAQKQVFSILLVSGQTSFFEMKLHTLLKKIISKSSQSLTSAEVSMMTAAILDLLVYMLKEETVDMDQLDKTISSLEVYY